MKKAAATLRETRRESAKVYGEVTTQIKNVHNLVGKQNRPRSFAQLKRVGTALILTPTPEPFSDVIGLALIGIGTAAERRKPPLTILEMCEEGREIFRGLSSSRLLR